MKTATTGTIKFIDIAFPTGFDVSAAKLIDRSGIGTGSISAQSPTVLIYTVTSPASVPAGTTIRLEIGRITNSDTEGDFRGILTTEDANNAIIDGPTNSFTFPIKSITGNDVSPNFMIRKTLLDDEAGNALGWNPNDVDDLFSISDDTNLGDPIENVFIDMVITNSNGVASCNAIPTDTPAFTIVCNEPPPEGAHLNYLITKLPSNVVTSSSLSVSESTISSPFDSIGPND